MAKYTTEQIKSLPEAILDHYYDPAIDERYVAEVYPLVGDDKVEALQDLILDVYFGHVTPTAFVSALMELVPDEKVYKEVLTKILGYDFLTIADSLGVDILELIQQNGGDPLMFRTEVPVSDVVEQIMKKVDADLSDERMAHRLENILKSWVTHARKDDQVEEMLMGNPKTSGIGLGKEKAAAIMLVAGEEIKKLEKRNVLVLADEEYARLHAEAEGAATQMERSSDSNMAAEATGRTEAQEQSEDAAGDASAQDDEQEPAPVPPIAKEKKKVDQGITFSMDDKDEIESIKERLGDSVLKNQRGIEITLETLADQALDSTGMPFDEEMHKRFRYAVDMYHRDLRDELETRSKLTMPTASGGLGLTDEQADKVMTLLKTEIGEYRKFIAIKATADKERYVEEKTARTEERAVHQERQAQARLDKKFTELTGKETRRDPSGAKSSSPSNMEPKRITVVAEDTSVSQEISTSEPADLFAEKKQDDAQSDQIPTPPAVMSAPESGDASEKGAVAEEKVDVKPAGTAPPPPGLPVVSDSELEKNEMRADMAQPSDEQLLATSAVGAVADGMAKEATNNADTVKKSDEDLSAMKLPVPKESTPSPAPKPIQEVKISPPPPAPVVTPKPVEEVKVPQSSASVASAPGSAMPAVAKDIQPRGVMSPPPPRAPTIVGQGKPVVSDVKFTPKLMGPVAELRATTVADFRRLSKDPKEATLKIRDKLDLLGQQSFELKAEGIKAWQESGANKAYLDILRESLDGKPVAEVIKAKEGTDAELSRREFDAIMELNRVIRFG